MKHSFTLFLSLFASISLYAQRPYQPMVVEGATWVYVDVGECVNQTPNETYTMHWIGSDTVVDGLMYNKYYRTEAERVFISGQRKFFQKPNSNIRTDYIREDTSEKRVYFNSEQFPEILGYNFDHDKGDTVRVGWWGASTYFIVDTVFYLAEIPYDWLYFYVGDTGGISLSDSIRVMANQNAMIFDPNRLCVGQILMEGIGPNDDFGMDDTNLVFYCRDSLDCSKSISTSVHKSPVTVNAHIFPNPASNQITLKTDVKTLINRIDLISVSGHIAQSWITPPTQGNSITLDLQLHSPGFYMLRLSTSDRQTHYSRVVIQ